MQKDLGPAMTSYHDRPLGWRDILFTFAPAILIVLAPLGYGLYRYRYGIIHFGPVAARAWSRPWFALSAVALIPLLWLALRRVRRAHRVVKLYKHGLTIRWTGGRRNTLLWNQIEGVSHQTIDKKFLGITIDQKERLKLHTGDGKPVRVDDHIRSLPELAARLKAKVYPALLPQLRTRFREGEPLHFGPVTLYQDEIQLRNQAISWNQVAHIDIQAGYLMVESEHRKPIRIAAGHIPNIELLIQLLQEGVQP